MPVACQWPDSGSVHAAALRIRTRGNRCAARAANDPRRAADRSAGPGSLSERAARVFEESREDRVGRGGIARKPFERRACRGEILALSREVTLVDAG